MNSSSMLPTGACPASAVVMAASTAKTPLAVADASADARIMFVNAAFAELLDSDATGWVGRPLSALGQGTTQLAYGTTVRIEIVLNGGRCLPAALSIAPVSGADGKPFCVLCSLVDARGEGADESISLDAEMLAQVAIAAGDLMSEAAAAASVSTTKPSRRSADEVALEAVSRVVHPVNESAS